MPRFKEIIFKVINDVKNFNFNSSLLCVGYYTYIIIPTRKYYLEKYKKNYPDVSFNIDSEEKKIEPGVGVPKIRSIPYYYYYIFSTIFHVYIVLHALILMYLKKNPNTIKYSCYLLGRLTIDTSVVNYTPYVQILSSGCHLCYRFFTLLRLITLKLDGIVFLLSDEDKLRKQISKSNCIEDNKLSCYRRIDYNYLRDNMFLKVTFPRNVLQPHDQSSCAIYLKPNRTLISFEFLKQRTSMLLKQCWLIFLLLFMIFTPFVLNSFLFDVNYIKNHHTCDPKLEKLYAEGKLSRWSITFEWFPPNHRALNALFDLLMGFIFLHDITAFLVCPMILSLILTEDLIVYWKDIRQRLDKMLNRIIELYRVDLSINYELGKLPQFDKITKLRQSTIRQVIIARELTREHIIIQQFMKDFFSLFRSYARYVSTCATFLFVYISLVLTLISLIVSTVQNSEVISLMRFIQIYGFLTLSMPILLLIRLRNLIKQAYPVITSLMALDKSIERKLGWSKLLYYYEREHNYSFTILNSLSLDWTTYFNYIATAASFLIVLETYF